MALNLGKKYTVDLGGEKLGRGTFGIVYLGAKVSDKQQVAVKQCEVSKDTDGQLAASELKNFQHLEVI